MSAFSKAIEARNRWREKFNEYLANEGKRYDPALADELTDLGEAYAAACAPLSDAERRAVYSAGVGRTWAA